MISNTLTAPADAFAPDPDRDGAPMPANISGLLSILRVLLHFGRHLAATIERVAATRDFWLFSAVFGTTSLPVIHAHLHRGILRAVALESLLLQRAATGQDIAASPLPPSAGDANADPCNEQFEAQTARLTAERAQYDAPADPANLATAEQIESEVRARPIGRTIAEIRRDLGIIAMMCTREFWDAMTDATRYFENAAAECPQHTQSGPDQSALTQENEPPQQQLAPGGNPPPHRKPRLETARHRAAPSSAQLPAARPRQNVPERYRNAAAPPAATGPPVKRAA